jgi:hypothetical protein
LFSILGSRFPLIVAKQASEERKQGKQRTDFREISIGGYGALPNQRGLQLFQLIAPG